MATFTATIFVLFLLLCVTSATSTQIGNYNVQEREKERWGSGFGASLIIDRLQGEKRMVGPGSSPPTCRWRCGRCNPCKAVHVAIQPGMSLKLEYYPEAWRCKCGNHLFMP